MDRLESLSESKTNAVIRVLVFLLAMSSGQAFGQDCAPVVAKFRQTSVRIRVEGVDRNSGAIRESFGSGVIVSERGHVLTNYHVVDLGTEFIDRAFGGSIGSGTVPPVPMRLVDAEPTHDLALLQFNNTAVVYEAAPTEKLEVASAGSSVCSFGYPLNVEFRPTGGVLGDASGPSGWWTLDVSTNPGESGSPVFDLLGNLLGLRVAGRADAVGIYYMVPISLAARLLAIVPKMPNTRPLLDGRVAQVESAVHRVLEFPNAVQASRTPPTLLQSLLVDTGPLKLFDVLSRFSDADIAQIEGGEALQRFFRRYYRFEEGTRLFEQVLQQQIGATVRVRYASGWRIYLQYVLLRFGGNSAEQLSSGSNFLNFDITWADAERVYGELAMDSVIANAGAFLFTEHNEIRKDVQTLREVVGITR
ncbi:MAG: trypsin-like peptidase domain-containing protein [Acidobacteria bacterium]|nr:trypsin-like peptidase domain-containing protein [Acidobacteriota bacterium]